MIAFADLVPFATEKVTLIGWNIIWNRWKSTLRARSIRSEPGPGNVNVNTVYFVKQARENTQISRKELLRIMFVKYTFTN